MGYLHYTEQQVFQFDDYLLKHLRAVIVSKFLQQESFLFSWINDGVQQSVWMHPTLPLSFEFEDNDGAPVNREWVEELLALANGPAGLRVVPEPETGARQR